MINDRSARAAGQVTTAVAAAISGQDVTVPAGVAARQVIAELAAGLDRACGRRDAPAGQPARPAAQLADAA